MSESEIIYHLENLINTGKKVILYDHDDRKILELFYKGVAERELLNVEIWHVQHTPDELRTAKEEHKANAADMADSYPFLKPISSNTMNEILDFYRLYDFSDKITVISESSQYGSLFNYVKSGILTPEEMVDAILCKM